MKQFLFGALFLLITSVGAQAQDTLFTYFNKGYAMMQTNRLHHCVVPLQNDGFLASTSIGGLDNYAALAATFLNAQGEVQFIAELFQESGFLPLLTLGSAMIALEDGNFAVVMDTREMALSNNNSNCHVIKFDINGDILWHYEYEHPWSEAGLTITEAADAGLLIAGWQQDDPNPTDILLIKLNAAGEEEWIKNYPAADGCYASALSANAYNNGDFLISGALNYGESCQAQFQRYIFRIDGNGDLVWERKFTGDTFGPKVRLLEDERIVMTSARSNGANNALYIALCDSIGEPLIEREFDLRNGTTIQSELQVLDHGYIGVTWSIRSINGIEKRRPLIIRFDEALDTLWTKPITYTDQYNMISRDIEQTADGGFVIAGFQHLGDFQFGWLAKVDSLGNTCGGFAYDCDSIVYSIPNAAESLPSDAKIDFSIGPNPIQNTLYLQYDLPSVLPFAWLHIFDLNGVEHRSKRIPTTLSSLEVPVPHLKDGVYIYLVRMADQVLSEGKIVVGAGGG